MLGGVLRIGGGGQQELAEPAFPGGTPVNQFVTDDEDGLGLHGQNNRQGRAFPDCQPIRDEDLPHGEYERRRPQKRPGPDR